MKKNLWVSSLFIIIIGISFYFYWNYSHKKTDYRFNTTFYKKTDIILKEKQFQLEIKKAGLKNTIISSSGYGTTLRLSKIQLHMVLHSKHIKPFFRSYTKVEGLIPFINTGSSGPII